MQGPKPGDDPELDALAAHLSQFAKVPVDHSLAKGTAPAHIQEAFGSWTSTFDNTSPICVAWFHEGVPSAKLLNTKTRHGVMGIRFIGAESAQEADYYVALCQKAGSGCGFIVFRTKLCPYRPCVSNRAFGRCMHFWGTQAANEKDAERGYQFWREQFERDPTSPNQRWKFEGNEAKRV